MDEERTTEAILGAAIEVSNVLGAGFLENVYRRALGFELRLRGLKVAEEVRFKVWYKRRCVGEYLADLVVDECVVVELKCVEHIGNVHLAQAINYLKASGLEVGLVLNFQQPKLEWRRVILNREPRMVADGRRPETEED